jgi:hypothetical protein
MLQARHRVCAKQNRYNADDVVKAYDCIALYSCTKGGVLGIARARNVHNVVATGRCGSARRLPT